MDSEISKINDAKVQSLGLHFNFITQTEKLIIEASSSKDNQHYVGQLIAHPYVHFQDIKNLLNQGQFITLIKNQEILKIKAGPVLIQLFPKQKSQIKELKDALKRSLEKQEQMQIVINLQNKKLESHQNMIKDLISIVQELKLSPKVTINMMQEMKREFNEKMNELNENMQREKSSIKRDQKQLLQKQQKRQRKIEQLLASVMPQKNQTKNTEIDAKQSNNKKQEVDALTKREDQEKIQKQAIKTFIWSEKLKSKQIQIDNNVITLKRSPFSLFLSYREFCLLNASFNNTLNTKKSWIIKINRNEGRIYLGVCLKSKIIQYNFNQQNIKWHKIGHGLYLIGSGGWCWSHSQKEFNGVDDKSFRFDVGDVILIEYDGMNNKLRLVKNKVDKFEMPIIKPPQNDAYHPCVGIWGQNTQVELIKQIETKD